MIFGNNSPRIGIISYCDKVRTLASVNHQYYAEKNGYTYIYDIAPTHHKVFNNKIEKLLKLITLFDWIFWIDDDAFFLQYTIPLEHFIKQDKNADVIFCKSPINPEGGWTYLSSGNFFLKNSPRAHEWLHECLRTDLNTVEKNWNNEQHGIFTRGDQDIMVYLLTNDSRFNKPGFHSLQEYENFNTRSYHFNKRSDEHFLVHFTGDDKYKQSLDFAKRYKLSPALIPYNEYKEYHGIYTP